jgi:hypothetical protein
LFFFFFVSFLKAGRPLGNISIDIIFFLLPWTCLWLALWAREREDEEEEGGGRERENGVIYCA